MIRFHNRVVDTQLGGVPAAQKFDKAREIVTKHYQWMIRTDYLPRICQGRGGEQRLQQRAQGVRGRTPRRRTCRRCRSSSRSPASGSATRWCGPTYNWNKIFDNGSGTLDAAVHVLGDGRRPRRRHHGCASIWIADFRRLYDFGEANKPDLTVPANKFNRAMRIDTRIVDPLQHLPPQTVGLPNSTPASTTCAGTSRSATSRARGW